MQEQKNNLIERPPVVVVMGHVDHGKTTLLDFIRKTNVAVKESGGITQHIGAYEIEHRGKRITFLDTPGHEAFSQMRSRGASVADIAILVVAADESVKPQTKEALSHIQAANIPFIVAIAKVDKPGADPEKVKQDLANEGVLVEGWGGKVPVASVSAQTGEGVNDLLDLILLVAELEELRANPEHPARGVIIESHLNPQRGPTVTLLILDGTLKRGDALVAGTVLGKVKILENFLGERAESLSFSSPAVILGWEKAPNVGEKFIVGNEPLLPQRSTPSSLPITAPTEDGNQYPMFLKADTAGSLEALEGAIRKLAEELGIQLKIVNAGIGDITDSEIRTAAATRATIISFRVKPTREAENVLKTLTLQIVSGDVIYQLLDEVKREFEARIKQQKESIISGKLEVLATFGEVGSRQVVGGRVTEGILKKGSPITVRRRGIKIAEGKIANLQINRQDVQEVLAESECGMLVEAPIPIVKNDILEITG